jgi:hypothetical protein
VSPRLTWSKAQLSALRDQTSLRALVALGDDLQRDAVALLDEAAFNGMAVASASIDTDIRFASEAERAKFMKEYLSAVGPLLKRYGAAKGEPYRFRVAIYPDPRSPEVSS